MGVSAYPCLTALPLIAFAQRECSCESDSIDGSNSCSRPAIRCCRNQETDPGCPGEDCRLDTIVRLWR